MLLKLAFAFSSIFQNSYHELCCQRSVLEGYPFWACDIAYRPSHNDKEKFSILVNPCMYTLYSIMIRILYFVRLILYFENVAIDITELHSFIIVNS